MRAFGYSLPSAIADLVDNSVTAEATRVDVRLHCAGDESWIAVLDDGEGMDAEALTGAMRLGSRSPDEARDPADLGRFGLGLKTASFSQARSLTVASRRRAVSGREVRCWDLDHVVMTGRWALLLQADPQVEHALALLDDVEHGTLVLLSRLDRLSGGAHIDDETAKTHFLRYADAVSKHLAMTFHRFLTPTGLRLSVDGRQVAPWDPFLTGIAHLQVGPAERLRLGGGTARPSPRGRSPAQQRREGGRLRRRPRALAARPGA